MKYEIKIYSALCTTKVFTVNEILADSLDFGEQRDISPETAAPYSCGNMKFTKKLPTKEILEKYNISEEEYNKIAEELETKLSFGMCGWCS